MGEFHQEGPRLGNQYDDDTLLREHLQRRLPAEMRREIEPELRALGDAAAGEWLRLADAAEADPPRHVPYDAWGRRIDEIVVSGAWRALDRIAAETGIVATAYERAHGPLSRIHQMAKLYLYHPSSATYSCPLAMTDGAARLLELYGDDRTRHMLGHLTSRVPSQFWTSGQWMTERTGGSDVSRTSTVARRTETPGEFLLSGTKWFTSATTAQMAVTLARIDGAPEGGRGLSVFAVELRNEAGALRGIRVNRLKDKLGTRALPTAELTLDGTPARVVGGEGEGVRKIAALFNVTRVYNAVAAVAGMRRAIALARDYASRRRAFGRLLAQHPLHAATLDDLDDRFRAAFLLTFHVVALLGRDECGVATDADQAALRLLTPVVKLYTAKEAVAIASEAIESFGGAGYVEDTGLPRLLRDAQVLPIWEGTTNVLSLDVWRAIERTDALPPWLRQSRDRLRAVAAVSSDGVGAAAAQLATALDRVERYVADTSDPAARERGARRLAFAIARTAAGIELLEHAVRATPSTLDGDTALALRWARRGPARGLDAPTAPPRPPSAE